MPYAASGLLGSFASGEFGSRNATGLVASITIRPLQAGRPPSAFGRSTQRNATRTMSAFAVSSTLRALIEEPSSTRDWSATADYGGLRSSLKSRSLPVGERRWNQRTRSDNSDAH